MSADPIDSTSDAETGPSRTSSGPRPKLRPIVVVVEDEAALREGLVTLLSDQGYEAVAASNLHEARAAIARVRPSVLILDLTLQGEFGADLLTELAEAPDAPATVIVSAFALASLVGQRFSVDVVQKPFEIETLLDRVRHAEQQARRPRRVAR